MKKKEIIAELKKDIEALAAMNRILTHARDGLLIVTEDNKIDAERKDKEIERLKAQLSDSQHIESVVIELNNENYYTISRLTKETQALKAEIEKLKAQIASAADYWKGEIKRI